MKTPPLFFSTLSWFTFFWLAFALKALAQEFPQAQVPFKQVLTQTASIKNAHPSELRKQAVEFIQFREGRLSERASLKVLMDCLQQARQNPFCHFLENPKKKKEDADFQVKERDLLLQKVVQALTQKKDFNSLSGLPESQIQKALRKILEWKDVEALSKYLLTSPSCPSQALLISFGQKAEEFFPEKKFVDLAVSFYLRSMACETKDLFPLKAYYRLGLLSVWLKQYSKADLLFQKILSYKNVTAEQLRKDNEYSLRALFWRAECSRITGNKLLFTLLKQKLEKEYPLSHQAILLSQDRFSRASKKILNNKDPFVESRSEKNPHLNAWVEAAEMLQMLKAHGLALELLDALHWGTNQVEPSFLLYLAVLYHRSQDRIGQFRMLFQAFRADPGLLSRNTLEFFYPLRQYELLKHFRTQIDPFFVASLIRQESGFNINARSPAGAFGLMQIRRKASKKQLFDPKTNIRLGIKYLQFLLKQYKNDTGLSLAAYNAGPDKVDSWLKRYPTSNQLLFLELIPYRETREYVSSILRNYFWYSKLYGHSLTTR